MVLRYTDIHLNIYYVHYACVCYQYGGAVGVVVDVVVWMWPCGCVGGGGEGLLERT